MTTMIGVTPRDGVDEQAEREVRRSAPPPREPAPSLGRWLRHERELRQVSIEEIAASLKIVGDSGQGLVQLVGKR